MLVGVWYTLIIIYSKRISHESLNRDTVASLGLLRGPSLLFVDSNPSIKNFRQALVLDKVQYVNHLYCSLSPAHTTHGMQLMSSVLDSTAFNSAQIYTIMES